MANAAVASWQTCIKMLQQLVGDTCTAPDTSTTCFAAAKGVVEKLVKADNTPLPNAVWKKLVHDLQVTRHLAALCIKAHQQNAAVPIRHLAASALSVWLPKAKDICRASPTSRIAVAVKQQLQDSGLLQHVAAMLNDAANDLTAVVAAVSARVNSGSSSIAAAESVGEVFRHVSRLLSIHRMACEAVAPTVSFSLEAILPAAPAAVRAILTTLRACSRMQRLAGREGSPLPVLLLAANPTYGAENSYYISAAHWGMTDLAQALQQHRLSGTLHSLPGTRELLLCPELVPCLAVALLVEALGLAAGVGAATGTSDRGAAESSTSTSGGGAQQQPAIAAAAAAAAAAGSPGHNQAASSSQASSGSNGVPGSSVNLAMNSLSSLSRGLFGLLGVEEGVLLQAAEEATDLLRAGALPVCSVVSEVYCYVQEYQAEQLSTPCGAANARLLLQLETDMLLGLAIHQLAASTWSSHPSAQALCELACQLGHTALMRLQCKVPLHKLPLSAAYTGPQLALQLQPAVPSSLPVGQQPIPPLPQGQQQQCHIVMPTAQLLAELLPLLTSRCLSMLQQQHAQWQQLLLVLQAQLQQADGDGQAAAAGTQGYLERVTLCGDIICTVSDLTKSMGLRGVKECVQHMCMHLGCVVVQQFLFTAAEGQAAVSTGSISRASSGQAATRHVMHAPEAVMQNLGDVLHVWEALLREAAVLRATAAQLYADGRIAAAVASVPGVGTAAGDELAASIVSAAESNMDNLVAALSTVFVQEVTGDSTHTPSVLVLALQSAGLGSDLQRQLFSCLCSMAKLSSLPGCNNSCPTAFWAKSLITARSWLSRAAANTAAAFVTGDADPQQPPHEAEDTQTVAVVSKLPSLFILGRCCMQWAQELQADPSLASPCDGTWQPEWEGFAGEVVLPPVQQWLQASSTQEQLLAAGYAPQALPQQLQQAVEAVQAVRESAGTSQHYTACLQEAVQQLQLVGSALCSFAVPCLCNNPVCTNLSGWAEVGLVSGRSCVCGGCCVARYCGRACQRAMWRQHKPVCAALAAAASAASKAAAVAAVASTGL